MLKVRKIAGLIKTAIRFCWIYILLNILITAIIATVGISLNLVNREVINRIVIDTNAGQIESIFFALIFAYAGLYVFQRISGFLGSLGVNIYQFKVDQLFQDMFNYKAYQTPQEYFFDNDFRDKYAQAGKGVGKISNFIYGIIRISFSTIISIVSSVVLFCMYEPFLTLFFMVVCVQSFFLNYYIVNKKYELDKEQVKEQRFHEYYKGLLVDKSSAKELRIFKTQKHFFNIWNESRDKLRIQKLKLSIKSIRLHNLASFNKLIIRIVATAILLVGIYHNKYNIGTFTLLLGLITSATSQIDSFVISIAQGTFGDVKYMLDYYDFVFSENKIDKKTLKILNQPLAKANTLMYGKFNKLEMKNVVYSYPNTSTNVIDNANIVINRGSIISILGYNGSGKTTLVKLLCGAISPQKGEIAINDILLSPENRANTFSYFGIAAQEFAKFSISIEDFIKLRCYDNIDTDNKMQDIYGNPLIANIIKKYPDIEKTILGKAYSPEGIDLSGGEWQLLNLVSAYYGTPEVIILDEPTASIDPIKEDELIKSLKNSLQGKTAILISHRLGFARIADTIVMMENGNIVEVGTHEVLMNRKGYYYQLFTKQKQLYIAENPPMRGGDQT